MNQPSVAPPLAGNILGSANNSFVIAEWQDEGGPVGPPSLIAPRHVHHKDDEAWYVLEGTLYVQSGENEMESAPVLPCSSPAERRTPFGIPVPVVFGTR